MGKVVSAVKRKQAFLFCAATVLGIIVVCIPLFVVAKYNYMSSDDFGYGAITHEAILNGQPWKIFGLAAKQAADTYFTWQGSFSAIFLFALQPGIWGEQYYQLGIYIIIFFLIMMQSVLIWRFQGAGRAKVSKLCLIGFCALMYMVQIFYVPYPGQCFYWFNGGLYYTIFYTLQLLLFSEIFVLSRFPAKLNGKQWIFYVWMLFLAVVIGGGNLATGLSTAVALFLLTVIFFMKKHKHSFYLLTLLLLFLISYMINAAAPGNGIRGQEPGYHSMSPVTTVFVTMWHCILNIYSWTDIKMLLILLIAVPFLWQMSGVIIRNWNFTFRFPAVFTILLFGVYAAQLAPITFMEGTYGPERMGDMMWFGYVLWIFCVEGYWLGWFRCRFGEERAFRKVKVFAKEYYGMLQLCCLMIWCVLVFMTNVRSSSTYKAWAAVRSGEAAKYGAENEERLEILRDPEIKDVYFYELQHRVEPIYVFDITGDPNDNANVFMARFYHKNTVNLIEED